MQNSLKTNVSIPKVQDLGKTVTPCRDIVASRVGRLADGGLPIGDRNCERRTAAGGTSQLYDLSS